VCFADGTFEAGCDGAGCDEAKLQTFPGDLSDWPMASMFMAVIDVELASTKS